MVYITDLIAEAKRLFRDCTLVVGGDFNSWPAHQLTDDHTDLVEVIHGPTRGNREIDRTFVNFSRSIDESGTLDPLEDELGRGSDHKIAYTFAEFRTPKPKIASYSYRYFTRAGADNFAIWLEHVDWTPVFEARSSSEKADAMQAVLREGMDAFFPFKTTTRRESDPPWINEGVRRLIRKRRKIYDKEGRLKKFKKLKKRVSRIIKDRAKIYWDTQRSTLMSPDASRAFFKNAKAYSTKQKPKQFDVRE